MPARILYSSQTATITTSDGNQFYFPVSSANCEFTKPVENVLSFGLIGAVNRLQTNVTTCRSMVKTFLNNVVTGVNTPLQQGNSGYGFNNTVNAAFLNKLTGDALNGNITVINVTPDGYIMSGILTRLGLDGANGSLATCDLEFAGVGEPFYYPVPSGIVGNQSLTGQLTAFSPVNGQFISGSAGLGCANSLRFTLDIPSDTISCLGTNPSGTQALVSGGYVMVARAPFHATVAVEGAGVDPSLYSPSQTFYWGSGIGVSLVNPILITRNFNQQVNTAAASYSYTIDDVICTFH